MMRRLTSRLASIHSPGPWIFALLLIATSCETSKFDEHPPRKILTEQEETAIVDRFIKNLYKDEKIISHPEVMHRIWRLRYYVDAGDRNFFLITYKGGAFSSGLIAYEGEILINGSDTTFDIKYEIEPHQLNWEDSVKKSFDELLKANQEH
jgi:hypothetical protein